MATNSSSGERRDVCERTQRDAHVGRDCAVDRESGRDACRRVELLTRRRRLSSAVESHTRSSLQQQRHQVRSQEARPARHQEDTPSNLHLR